MRDKKTIIRVGGMHCEHCAQSVQNAIQNIDDVKSVNVDLKNKKVTIKHNNDLDFKMIQKVISDLEFEFEGIEK